MLSNYEDFFNGQEEQQGKEDVSLPFEERRQGVISVGFFFWYCNFGCFDKQKKG